MPESTRPMDELKRRLAKSARPAPKKKKALGPQGKVPPGIQGLLKKTAGVLHADRARQWDSEERRDVTGWVSKSPAWAFSLALHFLAAVVLMNVVYFTQRERVSQMFRMSLRASAPGGDKQGDQDNGTNGKDNEDAAPAGPSDREASATGSIPLPPRDNTAIAVPMRVAGGDGGGKEGPGGIYVGRGGEGRGEALRKYGGDGQSEQAVVDGLAWLAAHQSDDGSWDPAGFTKKCPAESRCSDDRGEMNSYRYFDGYRAAITGLALLAFLGAGYSHMDDHLRPNDGTGPVSHQYTATIDRALSFLAKKQRQDGLFLSGGQEYQRAMYSHGMASLALIEAYSITQDARLRPHAQLAVKAMVEAQQETGGWDYSPEKTGRSDTSITGWQVMALRSARAAGLAVPKKTWDRVKGYNEAVLDPKTGKVGYAISMPNLHVDPGCNAMTAAGWVTRMYLGMPVDHPLAQKFEGQLLKVPPRYDSEWGQCSHWSMLEMAKADGHWSLYYTYYGTLAMFHHGGDAWEKWNAAMRACTLKTQQKAGHENGSWDPVTSDGAFGGRVYATAMNVLNLEIYYRYLPCYEVGSEFGLAPLVSTEDWTAISAALRNGTFHMRREAKPGDDGVTPPEEKTEALLADLKATDMMTRRNAAKELARRADKTAIPAMIEAARSEKTSLKPILIGYLGDFGDDKALMEFLVEHLRSDVSRVKNAAHAALKKATGEDIGPYPSEWEAWIRKK